MAIRTGAGKNIFLRALWLVMLLPAIGARAEPLTLSECLARSRERSLQVIQSAIAESQAQAALDAQKGQRLPQVLAVGNLEKSDDAAKQLEGSNQAVLRVEQTVYPFSGDWVRVRQQAAAAEAASLSRMESESDVALAVKELYFSIAGADQSLESLGKVEEKLVRLRDTILPKYPVGRVPQFDLIKVKTAISDLSRARELLVADRAAKRTELAQIMGLPATSDFAVKASTMVPPLPDAGRVAEQLPGNPSLRVLDQQVAVDELGIKAARSKRLPDLVADFDYGDSGPTAESMPPGWTFALGLRLPLYTWGTISSQIAQQAAQASLSRNRLEQEKQALNTELARAAAEAQAHLADQKRLSELLPETQSAASASIEQYRRGAMGILEATDALNLWLQTLLNERGAYYSYLADLAKLERLSGGGTMVDYGN